MFLPSHSETKERYFVYSVLVCRNLKKKLTEFKEEPDGVLFEVEGSRLLEGEHEVEVLRPPEDGHRRRLAHQLVAAGAMGGGVAQRLQRRRHHRHGADGC